MIGEGEGRSYHDNSDLCVGEVMDLAPTHTSTANDMASDSIWNSRGSSDAGLIHRGDGVDCLLGWHVDTGIVQGFLQ